MQEKSFLFMNHLLMEFFFVVFRGYIGNTDLFSIELFLYYSKKSGK